MKYLISGILLSILSLPIVAEKMDTRSVEKSLKDALLCKNDSLGTIRDLGKDKKALKKLGITYTVEGEDMDEVITLKLKKPLYLHGAITNIIKADLSNGIIVYGEFKGSPKKIIKNLKLEIGKTIEGNPPISKYVNPQTKANDCPNTIGLEPKGKSKFLLGCGWCNGG